MATQEMAVELIYERHSDGRYYIRSENLPGFRLAGTNFEALQADLDEVVKDLLLHNENFIVDVLRWVPGPEDIKKHLSRPGPEGKAVYIARGTIAA